MLINVPINMPIFCVKYRNTKAVNVELIYDREYELSVSIYKDVEIV